MVEPDTVIDGRYRVISRLGSGGMADVYLAKDELLGRQVAVKLLHHHFAADQEFVERFRREASSAAGLSHTNIVAIFDRGSWEDTYYIAMEYVAGRSLKEIVREQGPLEPAAAIDIVVQILRAARSAHKRGVIHRDLKPHNVIIDEDGRARVTDFGIARAGASDMTLTGSIMGTAQYLSPEQAQGHAVSAASDLYSIGVILYELLTGVVPFEGETAVAIAFKQVAAQPRAPSALNPAVPPALDAVVLRALAKEPGERYANADEFIAALDRARGALPATAGAAVLAAAPHDTGAFLPATAMAAAGAPPRPGAGPPTGSLLLPAAGELDGDGRPPPERRARRRRVLLWALAAAVIAAAAVVALLVLPASNSVTVPNVVGETEQAAAARLHRAGLSPTTTAASNPTVQSGQVISQAPAPASHVAKGARVSLVVSSGPSSSPLPSVEGLSEAQAARVLTVAGFKTVARNQPSNRIAQGTVIGSEPPAGTNRRLGSSVYVLVSSGPAQVHVPAVTGEAQTNAEAALTAAGLNVGPISQRVSPQAPGTVLAQSPRAGASVRTGAAVALTVAKASNEATVPSVVGQNETQAAAAVGAAGFNVRTVARTTSEASQVGVVLKQSPAAGRHARRGSAITLTVGTAPTTTTPTTTTPTTTTPTTTTPTTTTPTTTTTTTTTTPPPAG